MSQDVTLWFGPDHGMSEKTYTEVVSKFVNKIEKVYNLEDSATIRDCVWRNRERLKGIFYQKCSTSIGCWLDYNSVEEIAEEYPDEIVWSLNDLEESPVTFYQIIRNLP